MSVESALASMSAAHPNCFVFAISVPDGEDAAALSIGADYRSYIHHPAKLEDGDELTGPAFVVAVAGRRADVAAGLAHDAYFRARQASHLGRLNGGTVAWLPPADGTFPIIGELLEEARELLAQGHPGSCVVVAHSAIELMVRRVVGMRLGAEDPVSDPEVRDLLRRGLVSKQAIRAFELLLGKRPTTAHWWPAFRAHLDRRNERVHSAAAVTEADAAASLEAVEHAIAWFHQAALDSAA